MRILTIAIKEFWHNLRNPKVMLLLTLIPIIAILLLGTAVSNQFSNPAISMSNVQIEYYIAGEGSEFATSIVRLMNDFIDKSGTLQRVYQPQESVNRLKHNDIAAYVLINEAEQSVKLYKNQFYYEKAIILEGLLISAINHYNVTHNLTGHEADPSVIIDQAAKDYVSMQGLAGQEWPSAMDYYGVAFSILFVFYGMTTSITNTINDKKNGTLARALLSPAAQKELLVGKIIGEVAIKVIQMAIVIATTMFIYNVNWGAKPQYAFIMIFAQIILSVSIGTALGLIFSREEIAASLVHIMIVIFAFFGGSYMPLSGLGLLGQIGKFFSPIWWSTTGIFSLIYIGDTAIYSIALLVNVFLALVFIGIASLRIRKKEILVNG